MASKRSIERQTDYQQRRIAEAVRGLGGHAHPLVRPCLGRGCSNDVFGNRRFCMTCWPEMERAAEVEVKRLRTLVHGANRERKLQGGKRD